MSAERKEYYPVEKPTEDLGFGWERKGYRVVRFSSKDECEYTIVYVSFCFPFKPECLPEETLDGVILVTGSAPWATNPHWVLESYSEGNHYYAPLLSELQERGTPVIFADPILDSKFFLVEYALMAAELLAGVRLLARNPEIKLSRRDFLKIMAQASGLWLCLPFASWIAEKIPMLTSDGWELAEATRKLSDGLHPEIGSLVRRLRQIVLAEKKAWLMERFNQINRSLRRPHLATIMGLSHVGLENAIIDLSPQQRTQFLRELNSVIPLSEIVDPKSFYQITMFTPNNGGWTIETFEVPQLKIILK